MPQWILRTQILNSVSVLILLTVCTFTNRRSSTPSSNYVSINILTSPDCLADKNIPGVTGVVSSGAHTHPLATQYCISIYWCGRLQAKYF